MMALPLSFLEVLALPTVFIVVSAKGLLFTEPCDPKLKLTGLVASVLVLLVTPPNVIVVEADGTDVVVLLLLLSASVFNPNVGVLVGNDDDDDDDDELPNEILLSVDFVSSLFCVLFELSAGILVLVLLLLLLVVLVVVVAVVVPN